MGIAGKGLATFRTRANANADLSAPQQWTASGVPVAQLDAPARQQLFPF